MRSLGVLQEMHSPFLKAFLASSMRFCRRGEMDTSSFPKLVRAKSCPRRRMMTGSPLSARSNDAARLFR